jgi:glucosylceramidase
MVTAAINPDKSIVVVLFNPTNTARNIELQLLKQKVSFSISSNAIQTILIK